MSTVDEINSIGNGANFVRADLHIHSYGQNSGSFDVSDSAMTPENIVDTAAANEIKIISITDHNIIGNVERAIEYGKGKGILVIPGVEISTIQGHLLLYFPTYNQLSNFIGKLDIAADKKTCTQGIVACLDIAANFDGLGVLAHIEVDSGFEKTINRFSPQMEEIFKHKNLFGLEIKSRVAESFYTERDTNDDRKRMAKLRKTYLQLEDEYELPKLMSSDAHYLHQLGKNAEGNKRLTRIKIDELTFDAFKVALLTPLSRIRIEDLIPNRLPHFVGMKLEGGLLNNQIVKFSNNLTCIIGGRGAGKSTMLESVREASGNPSEKKVVDSEVWPDKITLVFEDETGKQDVFVREKASTTQNISDPINGISKILIESYGQGETAETIQHSDKNPLELLKFLDSFVEITDLQMLDKEHRDQLLANQTEIEKLSLEVKSISDVKKLKASTDSKLAMLKKEKVGGIVTYQQSLVKERSFRDGLIKDLKKLIENYESILLDKEIFKVVEELDESSIVVGNVEFKEVKKLVDEFSKAVDKVADSLKGELSLKVEAIKIQLKQWREKESGIQAKIDVKKKELTDLGIPFDMAQINKIANDAVYYDTKLKELERKGELLIEKQKDRKVILDQRRDTKSKTFNQRMVLSLNLNNNLKDTITDFSVNVKFIEGVFSPIFDEHIKNLMGYKTARVVKSQVIANNLSPFQLKEAVLKKDFATIENLSDGEGNKPFTRADVQQLFDKLSENNNLLDIESLEFEDRPQITVTKIIENPDGSKSPLTRSISFLSLGQQQAILLAILLHSKSKNPLIIDQPEDNLDSEFIYKTIVKNLRKIKEQRQVIIVTHNANIGVLGDAELIIPLKSSSTKSIIKGSGSIDNIQTKLLACDILEGGKQAFKRRKQIYGI